MKRWLAISLFCSVSLFAGIDAHFRKVPERPLLHQVPQIDAIYLINLDARPDKWQRSLRELQPYGIVPCRFPAINGWELPLKTLNELGVRFEQGMTGGSWAKRPDLVGLVDDFLKKDQIGQVFFACWMSQGAIGCSLSHLSVLQDAYDAGYETIWIMEDDIQVLSDPNQLSLLVEKLDTLASGWDVLYTDIDTDPDQIYYHAENDFQSDLKGDLWFFWRPDLPLDQNKLRRRKILSADFLQIGSRMRTHSMIIRRSGMKKILEAEKKRHLFVPYDHELALTPDIRLYTLRYPLVTFQESSSDTKAPLASSWIAHKEKELQGHPDPNEATLLMEYVYQMRPEVCLEVGAFNGVATYPLAQALKFVGQGTLHAVDEWDKKQPQLERTYQQFLHLILSADLEPYCQIVRKKPLEASAAFKDGSIDFLYLRGDLQEAKAYLPKVKSGGTIWLTNGDKLLSAPTVDYLMQECEWDREHFINIRSVIFRKKCGKLSL